MTRSPSAALARNLDQRGIHYGWVIAGVSFLTLITAAGFRSTVGVLIVPLQDEFGWSRATISAAVAINLVLYGLGGPFAAGLYDRFGIRRVIVIALATIAISSTLTTQMGAPWQLDVLWGVANGLATGAIGVTLAAVIANRWFVERRGVVTGMLTASNATGQLVFLPLLGWIVTSQGWRSAALTVSIVALAVTLATRRPLPPRQSRRHRPPPLRRRRRRPADLPAEPVPGSDRRASLTASRTSTFWLLTASFFVCGATTNGLIGTHLIPAAMDHGMSEVTAASLLAVIGVFDLVGHAVLRLAHRPVRPSLAPVLVLRLPRAVAARAPVRDRIVASRPRRVPRVLRARLGGDRATDGRDHGAGVRAGAGRGRRSAGSSAPTSSAPRSPPGAQARRARGSATTRRRSSRPASSRSSPPGLVIRITRTRLGSHVDRAHPGRSPCMRVCCRVVLAAVGLAVLLTGGAGAHPRLEANDTRRRMPSSTVAPRAVVVRLSEPAEPVGDGISVKGRRPRGRPRAGRRRGNDADDARSTRVEQGSYVVEWLVVGDRHATRRAGRSCSASGSRRGRRCRGGPPEESSSRRSAAGSRWPGSRSASECRSRRCSRVA